MRKLYSVVAVLCLAMSVAAGAASASGSAHFIKSASGASLSGSKLSCFFKEAGLSAGSTESVTCDATAATTYECVNGGGKNPSASNKTTTVSDVSQSGSFTAGQNGNLEGSVTLSPPTATLSCPGGQTTTFVGVTYSKVSITDNTSGASLAVSGSFTYTNPSAP